MPVRSAVNGERDSLHFQFSFLVKFFSLEKLKRAVWVFKSISGFVVLY